MVLGDIVEIKFGDRVPADVRVISSMDSRLVYLS